MTRQKGGGQRTCRRIKTLFCKQFLTYYYYLFLYETSYETKVTRTVITHFTPLTQHSHAILLNMFFAKHNIAFQHSGIDSVSQFRFESLPCWSRVDLERLLVLSGLDCCVLTCLENLGSNKPCKSIQKTCLWCLRRGGAYQAGGGDFTVQESKWDDEKAFLFRVQSDLDTCTLTLHTLKRVY